MNEDPEKFLLGCFDFERERASRRKNKPFTLERVQDALEFLDHPEKGLEVIHIAGTKGKGSTLEYIHFGLTQSGVKKIGLFTSPHYMSLCERIRIDEENIAISEFKGHAERVVELNGEKFNGDLSFFECMFLIAMLHFKKQGVKHTILETGLGGRLDATNSIPSSIQVLTRIDYDHMEILGDTLPLIAGEKAGIIKVKGNVWALSQEDSVNKVFDEACQKKKAKLNWVKLAERPKEINPSIWENAHLAKAVVDHVCPENKLEIDSYFSKPLMGRLQFAKHKEQLFLLDGAHNQISLKNLNLALDNIEKPIQLAFAMADSRNAKDLLKALDHQNIGEVNFFELPGGRPGIEPQDLLEDYRTINQHTPVNIKDDFTKWCKSPFEGIKLVTGSIYLVGEALKVIKA